MTTVFLNSGSDLQAAIDANPVGTVFQLAAGVYREGMLSPKAGQQFIGDPGGGTVLDGAVVLDGWQALENGLWRADGLPTPLDHTHGQAAVDHPLAQYREDLFINDELYQRVGSLAEVKAGTWYYDAATGSAYIADSPQGKSVELSSTPLAFQPSAPGVVIQNLTVEKYATDAQVGAIEAGQGWQIINNTVRWNHGAGINIGADDLVQGGHIVDNGQIGIEGWQADRARIIGVEIASNNYAGYDMDWDAGGAKIAGSAQVQFIANNVHDNHGVGLWGDIDDSQMQFVGNWVAGNDYNGIMYEISYGATVHDNTVLDNGQHGPRGGANAQIFISNSQGVDVAGNHVEVSAGGGNGVMMVYVDRGAGAQGPYDTKNNAVHDNSIVHLGGGSDGFGIYFNPALASTWTNTWDHNTYTVADANHPYWRFGTTDYTWQQLHQNTASETLGTLAVDGSLSPSTWGTGTIIVHASGDQYQGAPEFVVLFDGQQIGGPQSVSAIHGAGQWEDIALGGSFTSPHEVDVKFVNDASSGIAGADRNLYIDYITVNGQRYEGETASNDASLAMGSLDPHAGVMLVNGTLAFNTAPTLTPSPPTSGGTPPTPIPVPVPVPAPTPTPTPVPSSTISLRVSGDQWLGDPQFIVNVDGHQIGGIQDVSAPHSHGKWQTITLTGNFGVAHEVELQFINDAWGGSPGADRNLYVDYIDVNGHRYQGEAANNGATAGLTSVDPHAASMYVDGTLAFHLDSMPSAPIPSHGHGDFWHG
jgi:hypothetical protein